MYSTGNRFFRFRIKDSSVESFTPYYPSRSSVHCIKVLVIREDVYAVHAEGIYLFDKNARFKTFFKFKEGDISNAAYNSKSGTILLSTYLHGVVEFDTLAILSVTK
jgi:hypothetical protein